MCQHFTLIHIRNLQSTTDRCEIHVLFQSANEPIIECKVQIYARSKEFREMSECRPRFPHSYLARPIDSEFIDP